MKVEYLTTYLEGPKNFIAAAADIYGFEKQRH